MSGVHDISPNAGLGRRGLDESRCVYCGQPAGVMAMPANGGMAHVGCASRARKSVKLGPNPPMGIREVPKELIR